MSKIQTLIEFALSNDGIITSKDARELIGGSYYCNEGHHISEMLSRAVKSGTLERVKRGVFKVKTLSKVKHQDQIQHPDQTTLL